MGCAVLSRGHYTGSTMQQAFVALSIHSSQRPVLEAIGQAVPGFARQVLVGHLYKVLVAAVVQAIGRRDCKACSMQRNVQCYRVRGSPARQPSQGACVVGRCGFVVAACRPPFEQ